MDTNENILNLVKAQSELLLYLAEHFDGLLRLGRVAFDTYLEHLARTGQCERKPRFKFSHGAEFAIPGGRVVIASFHPSLQNTNTGKLTRGMFSDVFERARVLVGAAASVDAGQGVGGTAVSDRPRALIQASGLHPSCSAL